MFAYWTMGSSHGHFPLLECWMVNSREFRLPALEQNSRGDWNGVFQSETNLTNHG